MFFNILISFCSHIDDGRTDTEMLYDFAISFANANLQCLNRNKEIFKNIEFKMEEHSEIRNESVLKEFEKSQDVINAQRIYIDYDKLKIHDYCANETLISLSKNLNTKEFIECQNKTILNKNYHEESLYNLIEMCNFSNPQDSKICDNLIKEYYENININIKHVLISELYQFIMRYDTIYNKIEMKKQYNFKMTKFNTPKSHFISNAKAFYKQIGMIKNCKYLHVANYKKNCSHKTSSFNLNNVMKQNLLCLDIIFKNPIILFLNVEGNVKNKKHAKKLKKNYCFCDKCFKKSCLCIGDCIYNQTDHRNCYDVKLEDILNFNSSRFNYSINFHDLRFITVQSNVFTNRVKYCVYNMPEQHVIFYLISLIKKIEDIVEKIILFHCLLNILYLKVPILNKLCRFVIYIKLFYLNKHELTDDFMDLRIMYMFKCLISKSSLLLMDETGFKFKLKQIYKDYSNNRENKTLRIKLLYFYGFLITFLPQKSFFVTKAYLMTKFLTDIETNNIATFLYACNYQTTIKILIDNKLL